MFSPAAPLAAHIDRLATARGKRFGTMTLADIRALPPCST